MNSNINVRINKIEQLITPEDLWNKYKMTTEEALFVSECRKEISDIITGKSSKFLLIIGPCSIHDEESAIEYARRLSNFCTKYHSKMMIVMRVYFEKPRTTVGWKGYVYDPYLNDTCKINEGLEKARKLMKLITSMKVPIACEFLDTITPHFFSDYVSWGAIGARTTESQVHRQLASGMSMPIGFKNGTDGSIKIAVDAMIAAFNEHTFCGVDEKGKCSIVHTMGNPFTHIILRGGNNMTNYSKNDINQAIEILKKNCEISKINFNLGLMIDCSHDNSRKNFKNQSKTLDSVLETKFHGENMFSKILGVMIESNLIEGRQNICENMIFGQSVTDGCIGWIETVEILDKIYLSLEK
jgi:3-deoxy-7-phosphoheptulonate synthase